MLTYYKGRYNDYMIRTQQIPSGSGFLRLELQDMLTQKNYGVLLNPGQWSYNECESFVSFSVNLDTTTSNAPEGSQFRATLTPAATSSTSPLTYLNDVWDGSFGFFASQSVDKTSYVNQIPLSGSTLSADSSNEYIIMN